MITTNCLGQSSFESMFHFLKSLHSLSCSGIGSLCCLFAFRFQFVDRSKPMKIICGEDNACGKNAVYLRYQLTIFVKYLRLKYVLCQVHNSTNRTL